MNLKWDTSQYPIISIPEVWYHVSKNVILNKLVYFGRSNANEERKLSGRMLRLWYCMTTREVIEKSLAFMKVFFTSRKK